MLQREGKSLFLTPQDTFGSGFSLFSPCREKGREQFPVPAQQQVTRSVLEKATFIRKKKSTEKRKSFPKSKKKDQLQGQQKVPTPDLSLQWLLKAQPKPKNGPNRRI